MLRFSHTWLIIHSQLLNNATNRISTSQYPMIHEVIPIMDLLNNRLEVFFNDTSLPGVVRQGIQRAIIVLDKYYALTDESIMWKTAMCM